MPPIYSAKSSRSKHVSLSAIVLSIALVLAVLLPLSLVAQGQPQAQPSPSPQQSPQTSTPEAGGPGGDIGPIAIPKKAPEEPKKEEAPRKSKTAEGMPQYSLRVMAPLVTVDVGVLTKDGQFIPGLKPENFRILEDGVPQKVTGFNQTQAPITAVMLVEFAKNFYQFEYDALAASYTFASTLKKEDWIALISFDIKQHMLADFTQDKREIYEGLRSLQIPMSSETNIFDALYDTVDRLEGVEGRKYIILIASGKDTFSKKTLDQVYKKVQGSKDIAIYVVSTGQALRNWAESHGMMGLLCGITSRDSCSVEWAQVDNQMRQFAKMTGGKFWAPIFEAQFREIFGDLAQTIRNQYSLAYHPSNSTQDGSYRKIKVELVGTDGSPLKIRNEKGKDVKYQVVAREGYRAKREVE